MDVTGAHTLTGLPPAAQPPSDATGAGPVISDEDRAAEQRRAYNREAQQRSRQKRKGPAQAAAPSTPRAAPPPPPAAAAAEAPRPEVRYRDGSPSGPPRVIEIDRCNLETLVSGAATSIATVTGDGRAHLLGTIRMPGSGRTLAGEVGHHADVLLAIHGVALTPEQAAWGNLLTAVGLCAALVAQMPRITVEQAQQVAPAMQAQVDAALSPLAASAPPGVTH